MNPYKFDARLIHAIERKLVGSLRVKLCILQHVANWIFKHDYIAYFGPCGPDSPITLKPLCCYVVRVNRVALPVYGRIYVQGTLPFIVSKFAFIT